MIYLKDPNNGSPSPALTVFLASVGVAVLKLLLSGVVIGSVTLGVFSGTDFAAVVGSAGALYAAVQHPSLEEKDDKKPEGPRS